MGLPVQQQAKYWGIATAVFLIILWALGDVILPFILGGAIAYCLDPIADRMERIGLSRAASTAIITIAAIVFFIVIALLILPTLVRQSIALVNFAPQAFSELQQFLTQKFPSLMDTQSTLYLSLQSLGESIRSKGGALLNGVVTSALSLLNILVLVVIVPVVAFYLLLDWDNMVAKIDDLIPLEHREIVRQLARDIDKTLASFIRGQGTVCAIQGAYYAAALMLAGLQFGLVVGFVAGVISFIPYVGAIIGGGLAIGLALFQFWGNWVMIGVIVVIFVIGQFVEGNILTPKLVGESVGLHPVWLLFALSVFGLMFGFVGLLVAVPLAASLGVVTRFGIGRYKSGRLYQGPEFDQKD